MCLALVLKLLVAVLYGDWPVLSKSYAQTGSQNCDLVEMPFSQGGQRATGHCAVTECRIV